MSEELKALLEAVADGDENAFSTLSETYTPLIRAMSARFAPSFSAYPASSLVGMQDLEQEARLALYRAAQTFDRAQSKVSFGLYAKICIRNSFVSSLRRLASRERSSLNPPPTVSDKAEMDPLILASAADATGRLSDRIAQVLSPYEKTVFDLYISGMSVKSISLSVGKVEKSVHNAVYRIRVKIKGLLEN